MPIDIYDKRFQNWLKGVLGLNTTRAALCECISGKLENDVKAIPQPELKQFFFCLNENQIYRLKTQSKGTKEWKCKHLSCRDLMNNFLDNHTEKHALKYKWELQPESSDEDTNLGNEDKTLTWNIIMLYMHIDRNESADNYKSLECLDISHVIKVMRNCKLSSPDGTAEPFEEVIKSRNKLMHSPSNTINEEETRDIFKWTGKLLDCLDIAKETYYKETTKYLKDLAEEEFVIGNQSEECKQILEEVLKAKNIADELYQAIEDEKLRCKTKSKQLLDMLEKICRFRHLIMLMVTALAIVMMLLMVFKNEDVEITSLYYIRNKSQHSKDKSLEMNKAEYKLKVNEFLVKKCDAIEKDKAECDKKSEEYKKLEELEQKTKQSIQEIKVEIENERREATTSMHMESGDTADSFHSDEKEDGILENESGDFDFFGTKGKYRIPGKTLQLFLIGFKGETTVVRIDECAKIADLRKKASEIMHIEYNDLRLLYCGKELQTEDDNGVNQTLEDYNIADQANVFAHFRPSQGAKSKKIWYRMPVKNLQLFLKGLNEKTTIVHINQDATIADLRKKVFESMGGNIGFNLVHCGKNLRDKDSNGFTLKLKDYCIRNHANLYVTSPRPL